jgi:hypothetical protein
MGARKIQDENEARECIAKNEGIGTHVGSVGPISGYRQSFASRLECESCAR